ncbi:fatty acid desaturase family protein [Hoyosella subflava]|uniref:Fatty acid desaturase n=1 Tax=Hoyosella subflava (strain DSM 45089 / JCM 17490 / NBRC 109087 / DQS3-9A1) TaxID=443218 RepID=F6ELP7_HOYSD|nr:acyl-CoA desaturase [Hoyosella subflava]AEF41495.1 Fatty acid desaturase [Hoyosella subflava DQS3-9A1]
MSTTLNTAPKLTPDQIEAFGHEMDGIRQRVVADLGQRDADYIHKLIAVQRGLEVAGRGLLFFGFLPPAWLGGVAALSVAKILDNMEIGHNIMHGQYDWMQEPALTSKNFEWDNTIASDSWRYTHNYVHHTYTNVVGKDLDVNGFGVMRMNEQQPWHPVWLGNPLYAVLVMVLFEWGTAFQELEIERVVKSEKTLKQVYAQSGRGVRKVGRQALKDYVVFPALSGPFAPLTFAGNLTANVARNLWASSIIFCGHFPDGVEIFSEEETADETRGGWYYRQALGAANFTGGKLLHIMSGNLSFQIEHHLFPDLPAHRYAEISIEVQELLARYGLPYHTGSLAKQIGTVWRKIFTLALPNRRKDSEGRGEVAAATPRKELVTVG